MINKNIPGVQFSDNCFYKIKVPRSESGRSGVGKLQTAGQMMMSSENVKP